MLHCKSFFLLLFMLFFNRMKQMTHLVVLFSITSVVMLNMSLLARTFRVPHSRYDLIFGTITAFKLAELVRIHLIQICVSMRMSIFLILCLFVAQWIWKQIAEMFNCYFTPAITEGVLPLVFRLNFFFSLLNFHTHIHFLLYFIEHVLSLECWPNLE